MANSVLCVVLHYQFYSDINTVRAYSALKNIGNSNVGIEYISSFAYAGIDNDPGRNTLAMIPYNSWCEEMIWKEHKVSDCNILHISNTGSFSSKLNVPMGCLINQASNTAYLWQIENNGSWEWEASVCDRDLCLRISGPTESGSHWWKNLRPGDEFITVPAAVSVGDGNFDAVLGEMTKYRRKIIRKNVNDEYLPIIFNDYMNCLDANPTEEKLIPLIDKAAKAGAEYFVMDAGWYADGFWWDSVGEWNVCEKRYPNGFDKIFDYIRSKNMKPGLWLEPEVMGINCPTVNDFPDKCFFMRHGVKVISRSR